MKSRRGERNRGLIETRARGGFFATGLDKSKKRVWNALFGSAESRAIKIFHRPLTCALICLAIWLIRCSLKNDNAGTAHKFAGMTARGIQSAPVALSPSPLFSISLSLALTRVHRLLMHHSALPGEIPRNIFNLLLPINSSLSQMTLFPEESRFIFFYDLGGGGGVFYRGKIMNFWCVSEKWHLIIG